MKTANRIVMLALFLMIGLIACSEKKMEVGEGLLSPKFDIMPTDGGQGVELSKLKGKVVLVNFWASWCMPCREEMPSIEALYRSMSVNNNFSMVTILYKDDDKAALGYMKSLNYTFPVYTDNSGISARNFGVTGVPETYLIDKKGVLRKRVIGPADWNSPEAKSYINSLLAE